MSNFFKNFKLKAKFLSIISITLIFILILINTFLVHTFNTALINKEKEKGQEITKLFAHISVNSLYRQDYYTLENNVMQLQTTPSVLSARIFDNSNSLVTPSSNPLPKSKNNSITFRENIVYNDFAIGRAELVIDLSAFIKQANQYRLKMLFSSFLIILIVLIILYYLVNISVIKPINQLMEKIDLMSKGDFKEKIVIESNDEIGILSHNFNQLIESLNNNLSITSGVFESVPGVLIAVDENYKIIKWNSNTEDYVDANTDLMDKIIWEAIPFFAKFKDYYSEVLKTSNPMRLYREIYENKPDTILEISLFPLKENNNKGIVINVKDVTELEYMNAQFRQSQKMETIGILAGGLAHDFNNILCGISGALSLLKHKLHFTEHFSKKDASVYIQTIEEATNRAEDLVQRFMSLGKKQELQISRVDINEVFEHIYNIIKNTFEKSVEIKINYFDEPAITMADQTQIEQVILNLAINAYQSMTIMQQADQGGTLELLLEKFDADKNFLQTEPESLEITYWKISIIDTGVGISQENLQKIFDPFFTTHDNATNTGLGLPIAYNIIKQHNGIIKVNSEYGVGTNFMVYLPYVAADNTALLLKEEKEHFFKGEQQTILVADDEPIVLQIAKEILEEANYKVLVAQDGIKAIDILKEKYREIDLVILDINMPKLSGRDTFIEMKKIDPDVQVLLCSGLKIDDRIEKIMSLGIQHYIQKPFTMHKLSKKVFEIFRS
ncbi:MAG: response regulator [Candidatus Cloacimonetes bacterium]|nr:response regulator [Candidatus Cloacimonadota bacterium]